MSEILWEKIRQKPNTHILIERLFQAVCKTFYIKCIYTRPDQKISELFELCANQLLQRRGIGSIVLIITLQVTNCLLIVVTPTHCGDLVFFLSISMYSKIL